MDSSQKESSGVSFPEQNDNVQAMLDQRIFYLKTLYDVSKDIFMNINSEEILKTFLLMTMGNFGLVQAFISTIQIEPRKIDHIIPIGLNDDFAEKFEIQAEVILQKAKGKFMTGNISEISTSDRIDNELWIQLFFVIEEGYVGILGLGNKLSESKFDKQDKELVITLINNLMIALRTARAFEKIQILNTDLNIRNRQLVQTIDKLNCALRKIEILEAIKHNLSKFVPVTVSKLIENTSSIDSLNCAEKDCSVLFIDMEGYTKICEIMNPKKVSQLIEEYFSCFMEAIYENNGDVNETAGDGLMVLFLSEDQQINALQAVRAALAIKERAAMVNRGFDGVFQRPAFNIGINSGNALVGAAKFESYTGSRWTYTARGLLTNVAARIAGLASGGEVFLSEETAKRIACEFTPKLVGCFKLKNVSEPVEIYTLTAQ